MSVIKFAINDSKTISLDSGTIEGVSIIELFGGETSVLVKTTKGNYRRLCTTFEEGTTIGEEFCAIGIAVEALPIPVTTKKPKKRNRRKTKPAPFKCPYGENTAPPDEANDE